ncbi:hypothetical protein MPPM_0925 [Methylorubrum populi]|uniref:Glycosyltransferase RgtA/B/C/D-like domain-containing protein n=1 Tax=Methylorubrum populi TaxID=223967 RepID=A0A160PE36_9HYPH|nr:hypothetical protein [Methylorubrum populi]BAU89530.1 hypothetical protein MPPM_0925 [Methylorubrum populi]
MTVSPATASAPLARTPLDRRVEPDLRVALCAAICVGLALLWWVRGGWIFPLDDAYITLHNARVLIEGHDPNYGVPALVGASSLIHLSLVTAFSLVLPGEAAAYLVAGIGPVLFLAGLLTLAQRLSLPWPEGIALALAGLASGTGQFLNGLETGLVMAAVTWTLVLALDRPSRLLALICGLLPFLRPELGLLSLILMTRQTWSRLAAGSDRAAALRAVAADAALALAAASPWLLWNLAATGALLPRTMAAKQAFFGHPPGSLPASVVYAAAMTAGGIGPAAAALLFLGRDGPGPALLWFVSLFILGFALTNREVLAHNGYRYTFALLPIALFAVMRLGAARGPSVLRLLILAQWAVALAVAVAAPTEIAAQQERVAQYRAVAHWAQANLPQARLLIHDAGVIATASDLPLTDLVGLKSPDSIADHRRWTAPSNGAERFRALDAIARRSGVTHAIILDDAPDHFWASLADDLRRGGWSLDPIETGSARGPYILYRLAPPTDPAAK